MSTKTPRERFEELIEYGFGGSVLGLKKEVGLDQLWSLMDTLLEEARQEMKEKCLKCIPGEKNMPDHECDLLECEHYPRTDTHNNLIKEIRNSIQSL